MVSPLRTKHGFTNSIKVSKMAVKTLTMTNTPGAPSHRRTCTRSVRKKPKLLRHLTVRSIVFPQKQNWPKKLSSYILFSDEMPLSALITLTLINFVLKSIELINTYGKRHFREQRTSVTFRVRNSDNVSTSLQRCLYGWTQRY